MATKSVHDIEINDSAFQKFADLFKEYKALLDKTPDQWHRVSAEVDEAAAKTEDLEEALTDAAAQAAVLGHTFNQNNIFLHQTNEAIKSQPRLAAGVRDQSRLWEGIAKNTKDFASNIGNATTSLLKWASITGVISGLVGSGGLFGIDRLAIATGSARRSASGLGINPGEQSSFGINFGRYVDSNRVLNDVNEAQHDIQKRVRLTALGISTNDIDHKNTAELSAEYIDKLKTLVDKTPTALLRNVLDANQQQNVPTQEAERLKNTPRSELNLAQQQNRTDSASLALTQNQQKGWQDLQVQLERAGAQIERTFVVGLANLAGPIGHLSDSFVHVVTAFAGSEKIKGFIDSVAVSLDKFATEAGQPKFLEAVTQFADGVVELANSLKSVLPDIKSVVDTVKGAVGQLKPVGKILLETPGQGAKDARKLLRHAPDPAHPLYNDPGQPGFIGAVPDDTADDFKPTGTQPSQGSAPQGKDANSDGYTVYGPGQGPFQSPYENPGFVPQAYHPDTVAPASSRNPLLQNAAYRPWEQGGGGGGYSGGGYQNAGLVRPFSGAQGIGKAQQGKNVTEAHDFFIAAGWTEEQTAGLLSNISAESGFNPGAQNNSTGSHRGLAQWDATRQEGFRKLFGHTLEQSADPFHEQLFYIQYELTHGEKRAGDQLRRATTAAQSADIVNTQYERSDVGSGQRAADANSYQKQFKGPAVTVHINNSTGGNATVNASQLAT